MRGKHATKPVDEIVAEAHELAADGVRELVLVAQDTTYYGMDLYGEPRLRQLLEQLATVAGIDWIRLMYLYPQYIDDALLGTIAGADNILPYLDLPLQHINDRLLKRMARKVTRAETEDLLGRLRTQIPDLTLRTTMITGFPGETDEEFDELHQFIKDQAFERLGVFTYSYEPNTPSAQIPDHVPDEIQQQRRDILMETQRDIMRNGNEAKLGSQLEIILDAAVPGEENVWIGRTAADAPEVDSLAYVTGNDIPLKAGSIVTAEIVATQEYDLIAVAVGPAR